FLHCPSPSQLYSLSLHDALPIYGSVQRIRPATSARLSSRGRGQRTRQGGEGVAREPRDVQGDDLILARVGDVQPRGLRLEGNARDRKSTRLNSSHVAISYAVFCL